MSVELYPTIESLDEKLATLDDPALAARIALANPALFPSAAAREELSVFASAWKRFGKIALAATAVASLIAGYVVTPKLAPHPVVAPAPMVHKAAVRTAIAQPHLRPAIHKAVAAIAAPAPVALPAAAPAHHAIAAPAHAAALSHATAPAAMPRTQTSAAGASEPPLQYESNVQIASGNAPQGDMVAPNGTKTAIAASNNHTQWGPVQVVDSCTPSGGRLGAVLQQFRR